MYTLQGKPDQHATRIPCSVRIWSQTICISRGQRIATFHESPTDLDGSHYSREKGISDYTLSMSADRSVGPHLASLPLSTKEVVGLSQATIDSRLLGLPESYLRYAISTFNTCSQGPKQAGLQPPKGPARSLVIQSPRKPLVKCDMKHLSLNHCLSTIRRLPKSISTPSID
jgi:hypothetical protein